MADMKSIRENKLNMTQAELAELLDLEQSKISRWEKGTDPTLADILMLMQKTGMSFEEITGFRQAAPPALSLEDNWGRVRTLKEKLLPLIRDELEQLNARKNSAAHYLEELLTFFDQTARKPKTAFVGRVDAGKSTLINALLGRRVLPTAYAPTTSTLVYLKHIEDRPAFMKDQVWVFRGSQDEPLWDEARLYDASYCTDRRLASGGMELLEEYGTAGGSGARQDVSAILVFLDADLLRDTDLVDCPGFFVRPAWTDPLTMTAMQQVSALVFLSPARDFLNFNEIAYLQKLMQLLGPEQLFVLASKAQMLTDAQKNDLSALMDQQCHTLLDTLPEECRTVKEDVLRRRFFAYAADLPELYSEFNAALQELLENQTLAAAGRCNAAMWKQITACLTQVEQQIERQSRQQTEHTDGIDSVLEYHRSELEKLNGELHELIRQHRESCAGKLEKAYQNAIRVDTIAGQMEARKIQNKKAAIQHFIAWMLQDIQRQCSSIFQEELRALFNEIKARGWQTLEQQEYTLPRPDSSSVRTLAKVGADHSSTAAFALSATLAALPAVLMAPIALPAVSAATSAIAAARTFTGNWQKNAARKIAAAFAGTNTLEQYLTASKKLWDEAEQRHLSAYERTEQLMEYDLDQWQDQCTVQDLRSFGDLQAVKEFLTSLCALQPVLSRL